MACRGGGKRVVHEVITEYGEAINHVDVYSIRLIESVTSQATIVNFRQRGRKSVKTKSCLRRGTREHGTSGMHFDSTED